jgi:CheY-like chemotaxis protein
MADRLDVLVAEDNEINQQVVLMTLEMTGLTFKIVDNGQQAVSAWRALHPRVILMDISMPVMNGWDASRIIRAEEKLTGGHVPIIALTAHALQGDRERCLEAGMDDYVQKPITPDPLLTKLRDWLEPAVLSRMSAL